MIPKLLAEIKTRLGKERFEVLGKPFFRFYSIDMGKEYDLEVGYLTSLHLDSIPGLVVSNFPAGSYATLMYAGKNRGYQGSKALIEWVKLNNYEMDRWDSERGDTFACRYEVYLSDISQVPDHKDWIKEVAIKLK